MSVNEVQFARYTFCCIYYCFPDVLTIFMVSVKHWALLTRALMGYFHSATYWGWAIFCPPLISETTEPILKIQTASNSPGKTVERKSTLLTSESPMTSQVRSNTKCLAFSPRSRPKALSLQMVILDANNDHKSAWFETLTLQINILGLRWP